MSTPNNITLVNNFGEQTSNEILGPIKLPLVAGGIDGALLYSGTGVPSFSAAAGSYFFRKDPAGATTAVYTNPTAGNHWVAVGAGGGGVTQTTGTVTVATGDATGMVLDFVKTGKMVNVLVHQFAFTGGGAPLTATFTYPAGMGPLNPGSNGSNQIAIVGTDGTLTSGLAQFTASGAFFGSTLDGGDFTNAVDCSIYQANFSYVASDF